MDITLLIQVVLVAVAIVMVLLKGQWRLLGQGFRQAIRTFKSIWLRVFMGFTLSGLIHVLIPHELVAKWLGPTSGLKGILIGSFIGMFFTGGPYVRMPVIAAIYSAGAAVGPVIALLISSPILNLHALVAWQFPFLGIKLPLARYIACLFIPPVAAVAGEALYRFFTPI